MAESMSEQIFSIACALSKADESEKSMLRMICTAQEESAGERESGWGGVFLPARGRPDSDEAFVR